MMHNDYAAVNWLLILAPIWAPLLWLMFLVFLLSAWDYPRVRAQRRFYAEEDARRARRTPEEVEADCRAACIAMCGFDPGPSEQREKACS